MEKALTLAPPVDLLDILYDAATDFDKWPLFMEGFAEDFNSSSAVFIKFDSANHESSFNALYGVNPSLLCKYMELVENDPRLPTVLKYLGKPLLTQKLIAEDEWKSSEMYREVHGPGGLEYGLGCAINTGPTSYVSISVFRPPGGVPYTQADCERFGEYIPHFKRVIKLHDQFVKIEKERWAALSVLDDMPMGVIVTDSQTRILFANRPAQEIAASGDGLIIRHNELWANEQADSAALRNMVREGVESVLSGGTPKGNAMPLPRRGSDRPLHVRVSPMWSNDTLYNIKNLSRPVAAIYVTDPERPQETSAELLQRLFGLTGAEARLTERLVAGNSVKEVAVILGITEGTARTTLKIVFDKTSTSRQAELVKVVMSSPAWIGLQDQCKRFPN